MRGVKLYSSKKFDAETRRQYAAFDLETEGLGGKVLAASWCLEGDEPHYIKGDPVDIIAALVDVFEAHPEPLWFAHNAQYDWRYLIPEFDLRAYEYELRLRTETDVFEIVIEEPAITLRDSMALWPGTLRNLAASFAPDLPKLDLDFEGGLIFNPDNSAHAEYAKRDAVALVTALASFDEKIYRHYGTHLQRTTASTALKAWRITLGKDEQYWNPEAHEDFIRSGYFGGLVFLTTCEEVNGAETYDINSSYPYAMRTDGVPYGRPVSVDRIHWEKPGLYRVDITSPDSLRIPILPKRIIKGKSQSIIWPRGQFETVVTQLELAFAVEHGYQINRVHEGLIWEKTIFPFTEFINRAEILRREFKEKPEEQCAKLMQNSLYGKFGARRERRELFRPRTDHETLGATPWDDEGKWYVRTIYQEDMLCLPQWAVYITAAARLRLLRAAYQVGPENVIYGDTDSLTVRPGAGASLDVGAEYGQFKHEKTWRCFRAIAPKVYAGEIEGRGWKSACKGIPKKHIDGVLSRALFNDRFIADRVEILPRFIQTLKKADSRVIVRESTDPAKSASWQISGDEVRPILLEEFDTSRVKGKLHAVK